MVLQDRFRYRLSALGLAFIFGSRLYASGPAETRLQAAPTIKHSPLGCVADERYTRVAALFDPDEEIRSAKVYFRAAQYPDFYYVMMEPEAGEYRAYLPLPDDKTTHVVYYIEVVDEMFGSSRTVEYDPEVMRESECRRREPTVVWFAGENPNILVGALSQTASALPPGFQAAGLTGLISATGAVSGVGGVSVGLVAGVAAGAAGAGTLGVLAARSDEGTTTTVDHPRTFGGGASTTTIGGGTSTTTTVSGGTSTTTIGGVTSTTTTVSGGASTTTIGGVTSTTTTVSGGTSTTTIGGVTSTTTTVSGGTSTTTIGGVTSSTTTVSGGTSTTTIGGVTSTTTTVSGGTTTIAPATTTSTAPTTTTTPAQALTACFTVSDADGPAGCAVRFDASCSTGDIETYTWFFSDNPPSTEVTTSQTITYDWSDESACGNNPNFSRLVRLTVTSSGGSTASMNQTIRPASPAGLTVTSQTQQIVPTFFSSRLVAFQDEARSEAHVLVNEGQLDVVNVSTSYRHRLDGRKGQNTLEAYLTVQNRGETIWSFDFSMTEGFVPGSLKAEKGVVLSQSGRTIAVRLSGSAGERIRLSFQLRP